MKAWIKGGLWGLCISIIPPLPILIIVMGLYFESIFGKIFNCSYHPTAWFTPGSYDCTNSPVNFLIIFFPILLYFLIFFLIGALIGWIVGKVKSQKAEEKE